MTSGDERSESPNNSSGERSDPRDSENRPEGGSREKSSGERSEPRDSEEDVPLNIAGHESRDRPEEANGTPEAVADEDDDDLVTDFSVTDEHTDSESEEVEPVEVLVAMAKDGDIDPWDIDIVAVTDEFLDRLDEADLRTGGRALFYASVLLRMKSDAMMEDDEPEPAEEPWDAPVEEAPGGDPFAALEREMDRRLERKHARGTPQTLDELVRELRERERENYWKESREYDTSDSPHGYSRGTQTLDYRSADDLRMDDEPTEADVTGTAHDEHMEDLITETYMALREHYDKGRDEVLFREVVGSAGGRVDTFLAILFLSHRGQVTLQQDDLFGDLWVQDPAAVTESTEAVADGGEPQ